MEMRQGASSPQEPVEQRRVRVVVQAPLAKQEGVDVFVARVVGQDVPRVNVALENDDLRGGVAGARTVAAVTMQTDGTTPDSPTTSDGRAAAQWGWRDGQGAKTINEGKRC